MAKKNLKRLSDGDARKRLVAEAVYANSKGHLYDKDRRPLGISLAAIDDLDIRRLYPDAAFASANGVCFDAEGKEIAPRYATLLKDGWQGSPNASLCYLAVPFPNGLSFDEIGEAYDNEGHIEGCRNIFINEAGEVEVLFT
ncbi:MAG: hypothetical protein LBG81_05670 [Coriobacteriaceae bacterium]|jgi:hypothetical protein|nr:hypothetical protein [Coriobacteriaceae bacterium]